MLEIQILYTAKYFLSAKYNRNLTLNLKSVQQDGR